MESTCFSIVQLSPTVYRIVEDDNFRENPFIYLIRGDNKLVLIDTGCGTGNILKFIQEEFRENSPVSTLLHKILVINTHNHYDHVGCNFIFKPNVSDENSCCLDLCASSMNKNYSKDKFNTLGCFVGSDVKSYEITRWLDDEEDISLSDENSSNILKIFHTPGHTPDSICIFYPKDNRIFVGDVIYRYSSILAVGVGACPLIYENSVEKLYEFIDKTENRRNCSLVLSCGHIDDNLESIYLKKFIDLLKNINSGRQNCDSCSCWFKSYSNDDRSLSFQLRRFRFLDPILNPFFKLFYYFCRCFR